MSVLFVPYPLKKYQSVLIYWRRSRLRCLHILANASPRPALRQGVLPLGAAGARADKQIILLFTNLTFFYIS